MPSLFKDVFPDPHFPGDVKVQRILFDSFDETVTVENVWACAPRTESEVLRVLSWAAECNYRLGEALAANGGSLAKATTSSPGGFIWWNLRPVGRQLSWAPLLLDNAAAAVPDLEEAKRKGYTRAVLLLHLQPHFCKVLAIDTAARQARVQGATPMSKLLLAVAEQRLTVHNYPGCGDLTVAGVVCTGGHGSNGLQLPSSDTTTPAGSICNAVVTMRVAVYDRTTRQYVARTLTRSDARTGEQFLALLVNLGSALIFDLTLQLVPQYNVRCRTAMHAPSSHAKLFEYPEAFIPLAGNKPPAPAAGTLAELMLKSGMVSALTFPLTRKTWMRDISVVPVEDEPAGEQESQKLVGPFAYPYMHRAPIAVTSFMTCLAGAYPSRGFTRRFARGLSRMLCGAGPCANPTEDNGTMTIYPMAAQLPAQMSILEKGAASVCDYGVPGLIQSAAGPITGLCAKRRAELIADLTTGAVAKHAYPVPAPAGAAVPPPPLADTWGESHHVLLNVSPLGMRLRSHGLFLITSRHFLQHVLCEVNEAVELMSQKHGAGMLGQYPENLPVEYRLISLDNTFTTADGTTHDECAYLSFMRQDDQSRHYGWDIGVAVELVYFADAPGADLWMADLEAYLSTRCIFVNGTANKYQIAQDASTPSARIVLPWSKAWGYTAHGGAWRSDAVAERNRRDIPKLDKAVSTIANIADPYLVFTNGFMHFALGTAAAEIDGLPAEARALREWARPALNGFRHSPTTSSGGLNSVTTAVKAAEVSRVPGHVSMDDKMK